MVKSKERPVFDFPGQIRVVNKNGSVRMVPTMKATRRDLRRAIAKTTIEAMALGALRCLLDGYLVTDRVTVAHAYRAHGSDVTFKDAVTGMLGDMGFEVEDAG
jgi:hypothetical protein